MQGRRRRGVSDTMDKKKTVILMVLAACAAVAAGIGLFSGSPLYFQKTFVIGGADGPTSVFLAGRVGGRDLFFTAAAVLAGAAAGYYLIFKKRKK